MNRLAAAIVEHARVRARHKCGELFGHVAIMHVLVALAHVDRMGAVQEFAPRGHSVFFSVIPGRAAGASPESITTKRARRKAYATMTGRGYGFRLSLALGRMTFTATAWPVDH